ncbi:GHKL domain-containing protein [Hungatella effluvii]|uniref:GHKL domain-containing protein n=1 Tax=Hungatella effluvii TaxID=1096246 RepID=A0A2V3YBP5_9FIRM|nr:ATP-binding protein [Hungatella effluvii]PXX49227.1 GHKL domain-containing protein [Hungatella effluvii]
MIVFYFAIIIVLMFYLVFIVYYQSLFPVKGKGIPYILLTLVLIAASYICLNTWNLLLFNFPAVIIILILGLRISTGMNWSQSFYGGCTCAIIAYCFRGIFTSIISLIYSHQNFIYNVKAYYIITLFTLPASLLFLRVLRKTILPDHKIRQFLKHGSQLKTVITYEIAAIINLVVINSGRDHTPNINWYMGIALGACTLTLFMLVFAIYHSIRGTELQEYQWRTKALEEQFERQLQHYKSYQKYTESFRTFRHDYKYMMGTVKSLIKSNDNEKAILLLDNIYEDMQKKVKIHKQYSENVVLDAMLQDLANMCSEKEIRFSFNVFTPRDTELALVDAIRIFSNITNNAVEACEKIPISERFIEITTCIDQQWVTLEIINSFNGQIIIQNGMFITTKQEKYGHGFGLRIVQEISENIGGFVVYDTDMDNRTFLTRIHIPRFQTKNR